MRLQSEHPITVRGKIIGGAIPLICLPMVAKDKEELMNQARNLMCMAPDLLEWRIDGYDTAANIPDSLRTLADLRDAIQSIPLIFTCRIDSEGGLQAIARQIRLDLITAAIKTGLLEIIDIELCNDSDFIKSVLDTAGEHGVKVILSFHDFEKTPGEDVILERLIHARDLGADIAKVAVMPKDYNDVLILMSATLKARSQALKIPIVTVAMGGEGVVSRIAGGIFGSDITFAMGKRSSAPGQIPIGELRQAIAVLYR